MQHTGFFSFLPIFLLIRIICVCIGRTLLKSHSKSSWLLFPKVPIISILPAGFCQNWVQSRSSPYCLLCLLGNEIISKAGQEIVSVLLLRNESFCRYFKLKSLTLRYVAVLIIFAVCTGKTSFCQKLCNAVTSLCLSFYVHLDVFSSIPPPQVLKFTCMFIASNRQGRFAYLSISMA